MWRESAFCATLYAGRNLAPGHPSERPRPHLEYSMHKALSVFGPAQAGAGSSLHSVTNAPDTKTPGTRARLTDLDRAKGLAILLVVFGHLVPQEDPAGVTWYDPIRIAIYLFHMPFFMYLSGYVTFWSGAATMPLDRWPRLCMRRDL